MCRRLLAVVLVWLLVGSELPARPATSAPTPLGVVTQALNAHFGTASASPGTTIYEGDRLSAGQGGSLGIRVGPSQFYVLGRSGVAFHNLPNGAQAEVTAGTVAFSTAKSSGVEILANSATIRPLDGQSVSAQVTISGPKELLVSANRGDLTFSYNGESEVLAEGHAYRVILDPPDKDTAASNNASNPKAPKPGAKRRIGFLILIIGGTAGFTIPFIIRAFESPDRP